MARTKTSTRQRRRTRGEGTLYEKTRIWKTADGKTRSKKYWVAAISEGYVTENGRSQRRRRFFYGGSAAEARVKRDHYLTKVGKRTPREQIDSTTVEQYAERFMGHVKNHTRATTAHSYDHTLRLHILPRIGAMKLSDLTPDVVKAMYSALRSDVSPSMVARCHAVLRVMLNLAVEEHFIEMSPLHTIRRAAPRYKRPRIEPPGEEGAKKVLNAAKGHRLEALIVLAMTAGLRQGELFALRWSDIDLRRRTLFVQRSAQEVAGEITFEQPKTDSSRRRITLSRFAVESLKRRRTIASREGHDSELAFCSTAGCVLRKSNFLRRDWDPVRKAAGFPKLRFHGPAPHGGISAPYRWNER
jgi:integrase